MTTLELLAAYITDKLNLIIVALNAKITLADAPALTFKTITADPTQTVFNVDTNIIGSYLIFVAGTLQTYGHSKTGDRQITFTNGQTEGEEIVIIYTGQTA